MLHIFIEFLLTQDESYLKEFYEALDAPGSLIPRAGIRDRAGEIVEVNCFNWYLFLSQTKNY